MPTPRPLTAEQKKAAEKRYIREAFPMKMEEFPADQAQAEYNYYVNKVTRNMDKPTYDKLMKGMPSEVGDRQAYADKFAKENSDFYVKDLSAYLTPDEIAKMNAAKGKLKGSSLIDTTGTKENPNAFGPRYTALVVDPYVHKEIKDENEVPTGGIKYKLDYSPETGHKYDVEEVDYGTGIPRPSDRRLQELTDQAVEFNATTPRLVDGVDTTGKPKISNADMGAAVGAGGEILGSTIDVLDKQNNGKKSVGGAAVKGAASGAAAGFAVGGPWGAAVGGVVGGAAGTISAISGNKKIDADMREASIREQAAISMRNIQPMQNTQSSMYEFGTYGANMTKSVEVEKDEVVLRKNALGKFTLAADFKGGKTHNQGGEDYVLKQGDIVFPGKKRSTIMKNLQYGNHAKIESERMKLPRELPESEKLVKGITTGEPNKPQSAFVAGANYQPFDVEGRLTTPADILYPNGKSIHTNTLPSKWQMTYNQPEQKAAPKVTSKTAKSRVPEVDMEKLPSKGAVINEDSKGKFNQYSPISTSALKSVDTKPFDKKEFNRSYRAYKKDKLDSAEGGKDYTDKNSEVLDALKYAPAAANMIRGMQKPEKVSRRFLGADQVRYKDSSESIRKEVDIQSKIDADNASRFSGGSAQVARAGKAMAGTSRFKNMQAVNQGEQQRADQVTQFNTQTRNQTKGINLDLANKYDEMDSQNKAAVDAYFNRGAADFGRITTQIGRDRGMEKTQDMMLGMIDKDNYAFNKKTGKWELKK